MFLLLFTITLTGCSERNDKQIKNQVIKISENQHIQEFPFENNQGRVITVIDNDGHTVDFIVIAKGLKPKKEYIISYKNDNNGGVTFGPEANVTVKVGKIVGETQFKPNLQGELMVSMINPIRMLEGNNKSSFIIQTKDGTEVLKTAPILFKTKD